MSDVITVSDVHGSTNWKEIVKDAKPADTVIFLGDYFDLRGKGPFARTEAENFLEICEYARKRPKTVMLIGNHDFDYLFPISNLYARNPDIEKSRLFQKVLRAKADLLGMVYIDREFPKPIIFTHGGLTNTFLRNNGLKSPDDVNELWTSDPNKFDWLAYDPLSGAKSRGDGDNVWQTPTWVRQVSLFLDGVKGYDQVVGHTPVRMPVKFKTENGDTVLLTCTLDERYVPLNHEFTLDENTSGIQVLEF